ncbi:MAG: YCF48-related protein [Bacillota bacterium]|nr:YCF48-related protein [Bacillota bacterium]
MKKKKVLARTSMFLLGAALLLSGCSAKKETETGKDNKGQGLKWELIVNKSKIDGKVNIGEFIDDKKGITVGYGGEIHYTEDGGKTWPRANNESMCRYGVSIASDKIVAACGNAGQIRLSTDGGKNWSDGGKFLEKNYYVSFVDEKKGWVADSYKLAATEDGGKTYNEITLPSDFGAVATVYLSPSGTGYVLNAEGKLSITKDGGKTWTSKTILPAGEKVNIKTGTMQYAAVKFNDDKNGIAAVINNNGKKAVFRTEDGGSTWVKEEIPESEAAFGVAISPDGKYISLTGATNTVSVLKYKG